MNTAIHTAIAMVVAAIIAGGLMSDGLSEDSSMTIGMAGFWAYVVLASHLKWVE